MALVKSETICVACSGHYILVINEDDVERVSFCPFCAAPSDIQSDNDQDE